MYIEEAFSIFQKKKHVRIPARVSSLFNMNTEDTEKFFTVPTILSKVEVMLWSDKPTLTNIFPDKHTKDLNSSFEKLDRHLGYGAKVAIMSILLLETHARASKDPTTVDQELLPVMFSFLDDCLSSCLQSITRSLAMATSLRRSLFLDQLYWPSQYSREQMEK